ncbi:Hypothetical protein I596_1077 [Dokdonella koreensis DS-123]|uniref:Uncharacterized protein n=1 Tax=Dokdonella koreensis DS-123 TaxID=1300342 RepID=A0A160DS66_9GAMM|nr:Hypothetical protein I596_1077 [Dokdonella koreensis DS-123]
MGRRPHPRLPIGRAWQPPGPPACAVGRPCRRYRRHAGTGRGRLGSAP